MIRRIPFLISARLPVMLVSAFLSSAAAQTTAVSFVNQPLVPTSVVPGHGAFTLTVNGTGFAPGAVILRQRRLTDLRR
jgi:hypothetical protein